MKYSLVIPCYNESKNLPALVERCEMLLKDPEMEVVLVDNGSTDDTPAVMQQLTQSHAQIKCVRVPVNQGYGYGILMGLAQASGEHLGWTHADLQTDPRDFLEAKKREQAQNKPCFVKGKRYGRPLADVFFTFGMSVFETLLFLKPFYDINAQPVLFPKDFYLAIKDQAPHDFSLDLYFYYKAHEHGLPILRFPVHFGKRLHGVSHWNINWQAKLKFIKRTLAFSFHLRRQLHEKGD